MRDRQEEVEQHGAGLAAIGMGWPAAAADFRDKFEISFPLLVDHTKETYRALGYPRVGWHKLVGPKQVGRGVVSFLSGSGQALPKQDPAQLGGLAIVNTDGRAPFVHRATDASDTLPVDRLIEELRT